MMVRFRSALLCVIACIGCDSTSTTAPVVRFGLSSATPNLFVGSSIKLDAVAQASNPLPAVPLKWSSSNQGAVTVDANGIVRGIAPGTATIRAIAGDEIAEATITVINGGSTLRAGVFHTCGIASDGLYCWGDNGYAQLGSGTSASANTPQKVAGNVAFTSVSPAWDFTCGLAEDGAYCWGSDAAGQLGDGAQAFGKFLGNPTKVLNSTGFIRLSASGATTNESSAYCSDAICSAHACAITASGEMSCWGSGAGSQPTSVNLNSRFADVSVGYTYQCGVDQARIGHCWGGSTYKQSGPQPDGSNLPPLPVNTAFQTISASADHTCGLSVSGDVYCWGAHTTGQLGAPATDGCRTRFLTAPCRAEPVKVQSTSKFLAVSVGAAYPYTTDLNPTSHTCAITTDLTILCWGWNSSGQLGNGSTEDKYDPTQVSGTIRFRSVSAGLLHTCGVSIDGTGYCWGFNNRGQLGNGTSSNATTPVAIPRLSFK